jgi:hypothetical protein
MHQSQNLSFRATAKKNVFCLAAWSPLALPIISCEFYLLHKVKDAQIMRQSLAGGGDFLGMTSPLGFYLLFQSINDKSMGFRKYMRGMNERYFKNQSHML